MGAMVSGSPTYLFLGKEFIYLSIYHISCPCTFLPLFLFNVIIVIETLLMLILQTVLQICFWRFINTS